MRAARSVRMALAASAILFFAASASAADPAPDVVLLKSGGMVRGSIQELVPGVFVDVLLSDGSRRRYAAADVAYAGAAERMPTTGAPPTAAPAEATAAPAEATDADANAARLHFEADTPEVRLHERSGTVQATVYGRGGAASALGATYADLCTAPCDATLPPGQHTLAVSLRGRPPVEVPPIVVPPGNATLHAVYESRSGVRVAGLLLGLGTLLGGSVIAAVGAVGTTHEECRPSFVNGAPPFCTDQRDVDSTLVVAGVAVALVGSIVGLVMMSIGDHAELRIAPVTLRPLRAGLGPKPSGADVLGASGLGLTLAF